MCAWEITPDIGKKLSHQPAACILARCDTAQKYYYKGRQNHCHQLQFNYFIAYRHGHKYNWILRTILFCQELCHMEKGSPSTNYSHVFSLYIYMYVYTCNAYNRYTYVYIYV